MLMLTIPPVRTEEEYRAAYARLDELLALTIDEGSELEAELDTLTTLIYAYEQEHHRSEPLDPIDAIKHEMEERGWKNKDLEPLIGPKSRVSEILNRKRYLTLDQINNLHKALNIPLEIFINDDVLENI